MILLIVSMFFVLIACMIAVYILFKKIANLEKNLDSFNRKVDTLVQHEEVICKIHDCIYSQYQEMNERYDLLYKQYDLIDEAYITLTEKLETAEKRYSDGYEQFKYCKDKLDKLTKEEKPYDGSEVVRPDLSA